MEWNMDKCVSSILSHPPSKTAPPTLTGDTVLRRAPRSLGSPLDAKLNFLCQLRQSLESHDPLEIIQMYYFVLKNIHYYQCWKQMCHLIFCGNRDVFTATFDQFNVSLLNESINSWLAEPHRNTWRRICGIDSLMITQKNVMSNKCSASSLNYLSSLCIQATCQKGAFWDMHTCIFQSHSRIRIELPRTFMCKRKIDFIIIFYLFLGANLQ